MTIGAVFLLVINPHLFLLPKKDKLTKHDPTHGPWSTLAFFVWKGPKSIYPG